MNGTYKDLDGAAGTGLGAGDGLAGGADTLPAVPRSWLILL
jgi:hypothetical protein